MKAIVSIIISLFLIIKLSGKEPNPQALSCIPPMQHLSIQDSLTEKETLAVFIGTLYYLTNPIFELDNYSKFNEWLKEFGQKVNLLEFFASYGPMIDAISQVGNTMVQSGIRNFNPQDQNWAYGRALEMGADMNQAQKISSEVNQGSVDIWTYGQELIWIANVLPEYIKGNKVPFYTTGTISRNAIREYIPTLKAMGGDYVLEFLKPYDAYIIYLSAICISDYLGN